MDFSEIIVKSIESYPFAENTYVVNRNNFAECLIVDPGLEPDKILKYLEKKELKPVALLATHGHYDHIAGMGTIKDAWPECKIYIGRNEAGKLYDPKQNLSASFGLELSAPRADFLLKDGEKLELAGIPLEVRLTPGHSSGHVVYLLPTKPQPILFSGDVIFEQSIGRSDFPDGDHLQLMKSIKEKVLTLPDDTTIFPGHGNSTTVGRERKFNPFLRH